MHSIQGNGGYGLGPVACQIASHLVVGFNTIGLPPNTYTIGRILTSMGHSRLSLHGDIVSLVPAPTFQP